MFKDKLYTILRSLNKMVSCDNALERCINKRLDVSLKNYSKSVEKTCDYLLSRSNYKVMRNIVKLDKQKGDL